MADTGNSLAADLLAAWLHRSSNTIGGQFCTGNSIDTAEHVLHAQLFNLAYLTPETHKEMNMKRFLVPSGLMLILGFMLLASGSASANTCWQETSFSQWKVGCEVIGKTASGKYILLCCR